MSEILKTQKEQMERELIDIQNQLDGIESFMKDNKTTTSNGELINFVNKDSINRLNILRQKIEASTMKIKETKTPSDTTVLTDKITYSLAGGLIPYRETASLKMEKGRNKKPITTFVTLDIDAIDDILPDNIEGEDINLLEAIISLFLANIDEDQSIFTLNDIYRVERKNLDTRPNPKTQHQLKDRILKLMKTLITIDSSEEKNSYYPNLMYKETGNLLNAHFLEVEIKGSKTTAIKVLDTPILYKYSEAKKQLTNIPFILTNNKISKTESVLNLEKYLSRRISQMRNSKKMTRNILYSTIYENMNFNQKTNKARDKAKARTRINIEEILKGFMDKDYIKNYQIGKEGRNQYHKLIIELNK